MKREWLAVLAILLTLGKSAIREVEKSATREIRQRVGGGDIRVRIEPDGIDGLIDGRLKRLVVEASHFTLDGLPFTLETHRPKTGWIKQFVMRLQDVTLRGLRAERVDAEIPDVRYDRKLAMRKRIFRLSDTGVGRAEMVVRQEDLAVYIRRKYAPYVREVQVEITPTETHVRGTVVFLGSEVHFQAVGQLTPREGRFLELAEARIEMEGTELPPAAVERMRQWLNPLIDADRDLGISDGLYVEQVISERGQMRARGYAWIPRHTHSKPPNSPASSDQSDDRHR
ncbi:hypothetical protein HRbin15_00381 [bacterium HR15]|nr:hypothetical protein HRbin15_00381 [bacterium HR15]